MATLDRDAIVARAFALYVRRGRQPGHELDDWFEAERQLRAEADAIAKAKSAPKSPSIAPPAAKAAAANVPAVLSPPAPSVPAPKASPAAAPAPKASAPAAPGKAPAQDQGKKRGRKRR